MPVEMDKEKKCADKYKILVVDDSQLSIDLIFEFLGDSGYEMHSAVTGPMAFERLKNEKFDLVLLDVMMPVMNGYEATRRIRQIETINGEKVRIKIIAMTANAMSGDKEKCVEAGMDDYISKPFRPNDMKIILSENINQNIKV